MHVLGNRWKYALPDLFLDSVEQNIPKGGDRSTDDNMVDVQRGSQCGNRDAKILTGLVGEVLDGWITLAECFNQVQEDFIFWTADQSWVQATTLQRLGNQGAIAGNCLETARIATRTDGTILDDP